MFWRFENITFNKFYVLLYCLIYFAQNCQCSSVFDYKCISLRKEYSTSFLFHKICKCLMCCWINCVIDLFSSPFTSPFLFLDKRNVHGRQFAMNTEYKCILNAVTFAIKRFFMITSFMSTSNHFWFMGNCLNAFHKKL